MKIIKDNLVLPKPALLAVASVGWAILLYLCWILLSDSWERSMFALGAMAGQIPAEINPFTDRYTAHPYQTLMHTAAGILFVILGPLQFVSPIRRRFPLLHRISGRIFLPIGILSGVAAFLITLFFPVWGAGINTLIALVASIFMVFAFVNAYRLIRRRNFLKHREWMMRGFATGIAVGVFRVGLEDILPPLGYDFNAAWDIVMLASFPITLGATEVWIRITRPKRKVAASIASGVEPQPQV
jgi:uncharacterized membrane protein